MNIGETKENAQKRFAHAYRSFLIIWESSRWWTVAWLLFLLTGGLIPAAIVYTTKWVVDSVTAVVSSQLSPEVILDTVGPPILVMGALMISQRALGSLMQWINAVQAERVQDYLKELIHRKTSTIPYGLYEEDDFLDLLSLAKGQGSGSTLNLLGNVGGFLRSIISFVSIAALVTAYAWWIPLVLLGGALPAFLVSLWHNRRNHAWFKRTAQDRRWLGYYDMMLTMPAAAAEMRINNLGDFFRERYARLRRRLRGEQIRIIRDYALATFLVGFVGFGLTLVMMGWIGWRAVQGNATLGDLALFYQAFNQGKSLMGSLMGGVGKIYNDTLYLQHFFDLIDHAAVLPQAASPRAFPDRLRDGIRFNNVSFKYPRAEPYALKDFNMHIPAGKMVAVVGENGAGKSTFLKLLCRFYDTNAGTITVDGVDLRAFDETDLRRHISVMMQFPVKYQLPAELNIRLGDLENTNPTAQVEQAARIAGAHEFLSALPQGYESLLGRYFSSGMELSGGQWQRVSLARAFMRDAPIIVLDEPTTFMDSWAEHEWMQRFKDIAAGKTVLFITHRFTSAMQADLIYVMKDGRIIEAGSHDDLVSLNGYYAQSWRQQTTANGSSSHEARKVVDAGY